MKTITEISQQIKRTDRLSVYLDGKYSFSLAKDQLPQLGLKLGQQLSQEKIDELKGASTFGKLRDQVYNWLSIRLRSRWEVEDYLRHKTEDESLRSQLLSLLEEQGYIDDIKFAGAWIRHRNLIKPMSKRRLKQELLVKRIPMEIIDDSLSEQAIDDQTAIKELIAKRGHRYPDKQKFMAFLARQGFDYGTIKEALNEESQD